MNLERSESSAEPARPIQVEFQDKRTRELNNHLSVTILGERGLSLEQKKELVTAVAKLIEKERAAYKTEQKPSDEELQHYEENLLKSLIEGLKIQMDQSKTFGLINERDFRIKIYGGLWFLSPLRNNPAGEKWRRKMIAKGYPPSAVHERALTYPQGTISALRETTNPIEIAKEQLTKLKDEILE